MKTSRITFSAFTLIELLIVIAIIGILVTISMTSFASAQRRSRDTTRKAQVLNISSAIERYRSANGVYAPEYCDTRPTKNCYNGTFYLGGVGIKESQLSNDNLDTPEPAFDEDPLHKPESGFLLKFMGKPTTLSSTIAGGIADTQWTTSKSFGDAEFQTQIKNGRIRLTIMRDRYYIYAALENKGEKRNPAGAKCWNKVGGLNPSDYYSGVFLAYEDNCADEGNKYKIFARGSFGEPNPN